MTPELKFTSGPWSLPHFAEPDTNCACEYVLCDHLMGAVASVHCTGEGDDWQKGGDNPRFEQAVANAHLISAAPDLLEALMEAQEILAVFNGDGEPEPGSTAFKMRAAIAKATGQAVTPGERHE